MSTNTETLQCQASAGCGGASPHLSPCDVDTSATLASGPNGLGLAAPTRPLEGQHSGPAWGRPGCVRAHEAAATALAHSVPTLEGGASALAPSTAPRGLWMRGRYHERPPAGYCDGLSHLEWRGWLQAALCASGRSDGGTPSGHGAGEPYASTSEHDGWVWTPRDGWRNDSREAAGLPSSLDVIGTSRQTTLIVGESHGPHLATFVAIAARTAAARAALADIHRERARAARGRVLRARTDDERRRARTSARWHTGRAEGLVRRWQTVAECGTRTAYVATCAGCATGREPRALRCGLARECPTCRGAELAKRHEAIMAKVEAGNAYAAEAIARHGPTDAHPLGAFTWKFVSLTIPPGAGVARDAADIRRCLAMVNRWLADWLKKEGHETIRPVIFSAVEATPGHHRHGHVHLHCMMLAPYIPQALLADWWGRALESRPHPRRTVPSIDIEDIERLGDGIKHAGTRRLLTHTMRGRCGRPRLYGWRPIVDIRAANANAISELAKYAVKGLAFEDDAAYVDCLLALHRVRLFASSRCIVSLLVVPPSPMSREHCECCGLVGEWLHGVQRQRGPPEGARVYSCASIVGMA